MKKIILMVLAAVLLAVPCMAAKSVGYEEVACTSSAANTLTAATITSLKASYSDLWATVQVADYPVAYRTDGTAPTSSTKKTAPIGTVIWLESLSDLTGFKAIGVGGTANLAVTYYSGAAR